MSCKPTSRGLRYEAADRAFLDLNAASISAVVKYCSGPQSSTFNILDEILGPLPLEADAKAQALESHRTRHSTAVVSDDASLKSATTFRSTRTNAVARDTLTPPDAEPSAAVALRRRLAHSTHRDHACTVIDALLRATSKTRGDSSGEAEPWSMRFVHAGLAVLTISENFTEPVAARHIEELARLISIESRDVSSFNDYRGPTLDGPFVLQFCSSRASPFTASRQSESAVLVPTPQLTVLGAAEGVAKTITHFVAATTLQLLSDADDATWAAGASSVIGESLVKAVDRFAEFLIPLERGFEFTLTLERNANADTAHPVAGYWAIDHCDMTATLDRLRRLHRLGQLSQSSFHAMSLSSSAGTPQHDVRVGALSRMLEAAVQIAEMRGLSAVERAASTSQVLALLGVDAEDEEAVEPFRQFCEGISTGPFHKASLEQPCQGNEHHFRALAARLAFGALQWAATEYLAIGAVQSVQAMHHAKSALHRLAGISTTHTVTTVKLFCVGPSSEEVLSESDDQYDCRGGCCDCEIETVMACLVSSHRYVDRVLSQSRRRGLRSPASDANAAPTAAVRSGENLLFCELSRGSKVRRRINPLRHSHVVLVSRQELIEARKMYDSHPPDSLSLVGVRCQNAARLVTPLFRAIKEPRHVFERIFTVTAFIRCFWIVTGLPQRQLPKGRFFSDAATSDLHRLPLVMARRPLGRRFMPLSGNDLTQASLITSWMGLRLSKETDAQLRDHVLTPPVVICGDGGVIRFTSLLTWRAAAVVKAKALAHVVQPLLASLFHAKRSEKIVARLRISWVLRVVLTVQASLRCCASMQHALDQLRRRFIESRSKQVERLLARERATRMRQLHNAETEMVFVPDVGYVTAEDVRTAHAEEAEASLKRTEKRELTSRVLYARRRLDELAMEQVRAAIEALTQHERKARASIYDVAATEYRVVYDEFLRVNPYARFVQWEKHRRQEFIQSEQTCRNTILVSQFEPSVRDALEATESHEWASITRSSFEERIVLIQLREASQRHQILKTESERVNFMIKNLRLHDCLDDLSALLEDRRLQKQLLDLKVSSEKQTSSLALEQQEIARKQSGLTSVGGMMKVTSFAGKLKLSLRRINEMKMAQRQLDLEISLLAEVAAVTRKTIMAEQFKRDQLGAIESQERLFAQYLTVRATFYRKARRSLSLLAIQFAILKLPSEEYERRKALYMSSMLVLFEIAERCRVFAEERKTFWFMMRFEQQERKKIEDVINAWNRVFDDKYASPTRLLASLLDEQRAVRRMIAAAATRGIHENGPLDVKEVAIARGDFTEAFDIERAVDATLAVVGQTRPAPSTTLPMPYVSVKHRTASPNTRRLTHH